MGTMLRSVCMMACIHASAAVVCDRTGSDDDAVGYGTFVGDTLGYAADTTRYGALIGPQAGSCELSVSPTPETFQIWNYIYAQQAALLAPGALEEEERYRLSRVYDETGKWLRSFTEQTSNADAVAALAAMECHLRAAAESACTTRPREFVCCAMTTYTTWVRVATALSRVIEHVYGDTCGTPKRPAHAQAMFERLAGEIVDTAPGVGDGPNGAAGRAATAVLAWALKGVCDARNGDCPHLNVSSGLALAPIRSLSEQTTFAFATDLACL